MARGRQHPSILFIMTDQQHAGMMSCTGNEWLKTPALDRLAASGARFERADACNPVCVPNRFSLQTGRMPSAIGMRHNESRLRVPGEMVTSSLGPLFRRAGYETVYGGKVHVPGDLTKGMRKDGFRFITPDARQKLAESFAAFLKGPHERPFLGFVSFINPHDICYMAINDHARSQGGKPKGNVDSRTCEGILDRARNSGDLEKFIRDHCPPVPPNLEPPEGEPECIARHHLSSRAFHAYTRKKWTDEMWRLHRWLYCRLTEEVDRKIGIVLDALREAGLEENTLIVFTSDHGDLDGAHRLEHETLLYEESVRVPFIMSLKNRIPAGRVDATHLVSNGLDLLPTLCDYAGIPVPEGLHGCSVRAVAEGNMAGPAWRDHVVAESRNSRMVRTSRYKYVVYDCGERRETLVDMEEDPGEMKNLASEPKLAGVLNHHRRLLADWIDRTGDKIGAEYLIRPDG